MMKYKIGDKVRIRKGVRLSPYLKHVEGKTGRIKHIFQRSMFPYDVETNDHQIVACTNDEIELIGQQLYLL